VTRFQKTLTALSLGLVLAVPVLAHDYEGDNRKPSATLDAGNGQSITFTWSALHWRPEIFDSIAGNERMRNMMNTQRLNAVVTIKSPLALQFGEGKVPAGDQKAGFWVDEKGGWFFVVAGADGKPAAKAPLTLNKTGETYDHLEFVVLPGANKTSGVAKIRYGNYAASVEFSYGASQ
jgi:hypothetical protein